MLTDGGPIKFKTLLFTSKTAAVNFNAFADIPFRVTHVPSPLGPVPEFPASPHRLFVASYLVE
jgi:hypothetical protein